MNRKRIRKKKKLRNKILNIIKTYGGVYDSEIVMMLWDTWDTWEILMVLDELKREKSYKRPLYKSRCGY